jgi:acetyl esterase/lipase
VCGELIGGQLATSLALSECKAGEVGIAAAVVNSPVTDWTEIEDLEDFESSTQIMTTQTLLKERKVLFRKNEHWFDIFASPALLFRSAGIEVPKDVSSLPFNDMSELARLDREDFFQEQLALSGISSFGKPPPSTTEQDERVRKRKASRRFPSKALGLRLPAFRITTGEHSPLADQAMELANFMKQSLERSHGRDSSVNHPVEYLEKAGLGLWDSTPTGRANMSESARWLKTTLSH